MNQKISILGGGESGVGTAILAQKSGYRVWLSDRGKISDKYKSLLDAHAIAWEENQHSEEQILDADIIMKSPGIPDKAPIVQKAKEKGISIISEIEFAYMHCNAKLIGITGTNGKTTTTLLTYHILKNAGLNVGLAGNIGKSFALSVAEDQFDYYVIELSSFQLDGIEKFRPHIAVITNITPDHLDRYNYRYEDYIASKFRIAMNQTTEDALIVGIDSAPVAEGLTKFPISAQVYPFSQHTPSENGAYLTKDELIIHIKNDKFHMYINELALQGKHNAYNSMAAGIAARILDIKKERIRQSLSDFNNVEHRMEFVAKVRGVEYINDSKATNVNSAFFALESMNNPTIWIAGGVDKGNMYDELIPVVQNKVKTLIVLGEGAEKLYESFGSIIPEIISVGSMQEAVSAAYKLSQKGDVVLLSPACASFDLFENYEDRGNQFKQWVREL